MAGDARKYLASFFSTPFRRKTQLLAYLFLCVSKMPFIPPVCVAGGKAEGKVEGKAGEAAPPKENASVKERLVSNLKQQGKKSRLPAAAKEVSEPRKKGLVSCRGLPESLPASRTGESSSKSRQVRPRGKARPEETRFTLTLTPEAVLLLQRRNNSSSSSSCKKAVSESVPDSRRARRGLQLSHGRAAALVRTRCDVSSMVKVSLLNERHRYDDVEYEDEGDGQVDQRVVLKCTEWLRGLENVPVGRRKRAGAKSS
ncbi:proline-rich protein 18-like [Syngnathus scovelli]|uniref:proline-rich protein 18-like n=1 Tax=Syngnathus scovelli TaxID=161590 RepID=UPI00210FC7EB|nr:proline-rich protein 18-like [Syngnathus scovelli]